MTSQTERGAAFAALHEREGMFLLPNPWDAGSAKILAALGYDALATSSAGIAASEGLGDYEIIRDMKMLHIRKLAEATDLPLSADLENGFGHHPEYCAETIRLGAEAGNLSRGTPPGNGDRLPARLYPITAIPKSASSISSRFLVFASAVS